MHEPGRRFSGTPRVRPCRLASGIHASRRPLKPRPGSCLYAHPFVWWGVHLDLSSVLIEGKHRLGMGWGRFSPTVWRHGCRRRAYKDVFTACRRRPPPTDACRVLSTTGHAERQYQVQMPFALTLTLSRKRERGLFRAAASVRGVVPQAGEGIVSRCRLRPWSRPASGRGDCFALPPPSVESSRTRERGSLASSGIVGLASETGNSFTVRKSSRDEPGAWWRWVTAVDGCGRGGLSAKGTAGRRGDRCLRLARVRCRRPSAGPSKRLCGRPSPVPPGS